MTGNNLKNRKKEIDISCAASKNEKIMRSPVDIQQKVQQQHRVQPYCHLGDDRELHPKLLLQPHCDTKQILKGLQLQHIAHRVERQQLEYKESTTPTRKTKSLSMPDVRQMDSNHTIVHDTTSQSRQGTTVAATKVHAPDEFQHRVQQNQSPDDDDNDSHSNLLVPVVPQHEAYKKHLAARYALESNDSKVTTDLNMYREHHSGNRHDITNYNTNIVHAPVIIEQREQREQLEPIFPTDETDPKFSLLATCNEKMKDLTRQAQEIQALQQQLVSYQNSSNIQPMGNTYNQAVRYHDGYNNIANLHSSVFGVPATNLSPPVIQEPQRTRLLSDIHNMTHNTNRNCNTIYNNFTTTPISEIVFVVLDPNTITSNHNNMNGTSRTRLPSPAPDVVYSSLSHSETKQHKQQRRQKKRQQQRWKQQS
jgi:hypothetical protein